MGNSIAVRDPNKMSEWAKRIEMCRSSGKTVVEWCKENNVSDKVYYYWYRKIKHFVQGSDCNEFYEIPTAGISQSTGGIASTITVGSLRADIYNGANSETLVAIIKAMQQC